MPLFRVEVLDPAVARVADDSEVVEGSERRSKLLLAQEHLLALVAPGEPLISFEALRSLDLSRAKPGPSYRPIAIEG